MGIAFKGAEVGDEITFVYDPCQHNLHYWVNLAHNRTELEWMDNLVGEISTDYDGMKDALYPFVQIKGGSSAQPVAIEVVDMPPPSLPAVEW